MSHLTSNFAAQSFPSNTSPAFLTQAGLEDLLAKPMLNTAICRNVSDDLNEEKDSLLFDGRDANVQTFQHIHGNYAKRRYKHVESKVGRYIASVRAEERKRRDAKLVRCSSAPESKLNPETVAETDKQHKGFSTNDLYKLHESTSDYVDTEVMTSSAYSSSTQGGGASSNGASRHESSDDAVNGTDFIDKQTYAQLIYEKDHLEALLEDKRSECLRHKRNVDFLRIELANCQDELKSLRAKNSASNLRYTTGFMGYSLDGRLGGNAYDSHSLHKNAITKATQTDLVNTSESLATPKRPSTNENILRLRANSNSCNQQIINSNRRTDENMAALNRKIPQDNLPTPGSLAANINSPASDTEFTYYDHHYVPIPTMSTSPDNLIESPQDSEENMPKNARAAAAKKCAQRTSTSFRQRLNRLFGRCVRCDDANQSASAYGNSFTENTIPMMQLSKSQDARSKRNQRRNVN